MVKRKMSISDGAMVTIITKEKATVTVLCKICSRSVERDWFTVSIS